MPDPRHPFSITMKLPVPPSANVYWRMLPIGGKKGNRQIIVPSKEAEAYKQDVGWRVKAYGLMTPLQGRVLVGLRLYPHRPLDWKKSAAANPMEWDDDVRSIDLDNARKCLYDALQGVAFTNDKYVFADWGVREEPDGGEARVVVTIATYQRGDNPQQALFARDEL